MNASGKLHKGLAAVLLSALHVIPANAAEPVAIVQEIDAANAGVSLMDLVSPGDVVALKPGERLVLGYFVSCLEETVAGGTVTVGARESAIADGSVQRRKVDCDGGGLALSEQQTANSGVIVFRKASAPANAVRPTARLFGLSPIVRSSTGGALVITRIDTPAPAIEIAAQGGATDLAGLGIALTPGGVYRAELTAPESVRTVIFEIDAFAQPGYGPIVSRLLRI